MSFDLPIISINFLFSVFFFFLGRRRALIHEKTRPRITLYEQGLIFVRVFLANHILTSCSSGPPLAYMRNNVLERYSGVACRATARTSQLMQSARCIRRRRTRRAATPCSSSTRHWKRCCGSTRWRTRCGNTGGACRRRSTLRWKTRSRAGPGRGRSASASSTVM